MDITCKLNGVKYLLVEQIVTKKTADEFEAACKKHNCLLQKMRLINGGFFGVSYMSISILVPESNVAAWSNENLA